MTPLFIPLKTEYFNQFAAGTKPYEMRKYGPRWNEKTCPVGRPVVLSLGYGKQSRLSGVITKFERQMAYAPIRSVEEFDALNKIYGPQDVELAIIHIKLTP